MSITAWIELHNDVWTSPKMKPLASSVNGLADQIKNALKNEYANNEQNQENAINAELDNLETWKIQQENAINSVYAARENAIQAQIDALDVETAAEDRATKHKEYTDKISDLQGQIKYSHDDYNKAQLQKQLAQEQADYQSELNSEAVTDKKSALQSQLDAVKSEQSTEIANIDSIYNAKKDALDKQLQAVKDTYDKETSDAALEAQAEKMIVDNNQKDIVTLLNSYGDQYKQAGQTLGSRLSEGFEPTIDNIKDMISSITVEISAARDNALSAMAMAQQNAASSKKVQQNVDNLTTNNIKINVTTPAKLSPSQVVTQAQLATQRALFQIG